MYKQWKVVIWLGRHVEAISYLLIHTSCVRTWVAKTSKIVGVI